MELTFHSTNTLEWTRPDQSMRKDLLFFVLFKSKPRQALKVLEEARAAFQVAAELRSVVLQEVTELIGVKHRHIAALSALCRAWIQCINR